MNEKHHVFIRKYLPMAGMILLALSGAILLFFTIFRMQVIGDFVQRLLDILAPILYGVVLAYLLSPICNKIEGALLALLKKKRERQASSPQKAGGKVFPRFFRRKESGKAESAISGLAITASLLLMLLAVYGLIALVVPQVVSSIRSIIEALPSYLQTAENWMIQFLNDNPDMARTVQQATDSAINWLQNWIRTDLLPNLNNIVSGVSSGVLGVVNVLKNLVIGVIVTIYLLASRRKFASQAKKIVYSLLPVNLANSFIAHTRYAHRVFGGFISGKILDSLIIGVICFVGASFMRLPYSMLVSVIIGITNIIPFFGPFIGAIPCGLLILLADPLRCLYFVFFIVILQQFDGNILGPKILGDSTGLSSFWVLFSILLFGGLFGFVGMVIGVPTFAVIYNLINQFINRRLEKKELSTNTDFYDNLDHIGEGKEYVKKQQVRTPAREKK